MKILVPFAILVAVLMGAMFWDNPAPRADVVIVNRGEVFTLDPQRMSFVQDFRLAYALYEGLVRWNNDDLSIQPAAANLPEISADQRTYTFHIRPDAKWSNGDPVTAHDFAFSFQRLLWPDTAADYSNLFFIIDGAEEFFHWRNEQLRTLAGAAAGESSGAAAITAYETAEKRFRETVGIAAVDDRTLRLTLRQPTPYVVELLCFAVASPVHRPTVEGWKAADGVGGRIVPLWNERKFVRLNSMTGRLEQDHQWARPGTLVSNGPYVLSQWRYRRDMRLERNPHYHSPQMVRNNSVLLLSIEDANTAVLAFESGAVDWVVEVGAEYQSDMLGNGREDVRAIPMFGTDFFSFNCRPTQADGRPNPFADARVRRAFAMAIDRKAIVTTATRLNEPVMHALIPHQSIPGYESPNGLPENIEQARAELAAAGWRQSEVRNQKSEVSDQDNPKSKIQNPKPGPANQLINEQSEPFPTVDLLYTSGSARYRWMSLTLASQWEQALGVHVQLRSVDTKFYKEDLKQGKFMIARGRWYGDYGDPTTFLDINRTADGNNDRGYSSARFDAIMEAAAKQPDVHQRYQLLQDAERLIVQEDLPLLPVCQLVQVCLYDPAKVRGLSTHPRFIQYLWEIEVLKDTKAAASR